MQAIWVPSLVWEDPTSEGQSNPCTDTTEPMHSNKRPHTAKNKIDVLVKVIYWEDSVTPFFYSISNLQNRGKHVSGITCLLVLQYLYE